MDAAAAAIKRWTVGLRSRESQRRNRVGAVGSRGIEALHRGQEGCQASSSRRQTGHRTSTLATRARAAQIPV